MFQPGSIVKANAEGRKKYSITGEAMHKGKVLALDDPEAIRTGLRTVDTTMLIKVIEHEQKHQEGRIFGVEPAYFELIAKEKTSHEFKVGDKVKVKSHEELKKIAQQIDGDGDMRFEYDVFTKSMADKFCGTIQTISKVIDIDECKIYHFENDNRPFSIFKEWFEPVEETTIKEELVTECQFKVGDKIRGLDSDDKLNNYGIIPKHVLEAEIENIRSEKSIMINVIKSANKDILPEGSGYVINPKLFVLIPQYECKFKVGDFIKGVREFKHNQRSIIHKAELKSITGKNKGFIQVLEGNWGPSKKDFECEIGHFELWTPPVKKESILPEKVKKATTTALKTAVEMNPFSDCEVEGESMMAEIKTSNPFINSRAIMSDRAIADTTIISSMNSSPRDYSSTVSTRPYSLGTEGPKDMLTKIETKKNRFEGETKMKTNNMMKSFGLDNIGVDKSGMFKLSMLGLAIKGRDSGWAVYDFEEQVMTDVMDMIIDTKDMIFRMPVAVVEEGDLILHESVPYYVIEIINKNRIRVFNPITNKEELIGPKKNMFGFKFYVKVISMFNMMMPQGGNLQDPTAMAMPLMFMNMGDSEGDGMEAMMPFMMMPMMQQMMGGKPADASVNPMATMMPMMLPMLMGKDKGDKDGMSGMMMAFAFSGMMGGQGFPGLPAPASTPKKAGKKAKDTKEVKAEE